MGNPFVSDPSLGLFTALNITASTVLTTSGVQMPAFLATVSVVVAGTAGGTINDASSVVGANAGNVIMAVPNIVGLYQLRWACTNGLVVIPGAGQTVCVAYSK